MTQEQKPLPTWILIVSGLFAVMELLVSFSLAFSAESIGDKIDLNAKGVDFLMQVWATRQFALGFIFAFATFKRSAPMLTLAYVFLLVMFAGDFIIGMLQKDATLSITALVMCAIAAGLIFFIHWKS
jgi:hypothetical protein